MVRIQIAHLAGMIWTVSRESRLSPRRAGPVCVGIVYIAQSDCAAWIFSGVRPRDVVGVHLAIFGQILSGRKRPNLAKCILGRFLPENVGVFQSKSLLTYSSKPPKGPSSQRAF